MIQLRKALMALKAASIVKNFISIRVTLLLVCAILSFGELKAYIKPTREEIRFAGNTYVMARSMGDVNGVWNQYLPAGQNLDDWTRALSLRLYYGESDAEALMEKQKALVEKNFPSAEFATQVTRDGREARVRYLAQARKPLPVAEFSMWRFIEMEEPRTQILAYQFSVRQFTENTDELKAVLNRQLEVWTRNFLTTRFDPPQYRVNIKQIDAMETEGVFLIKEGEMAKGLSMMMEAVKMDPQNPIRHLHLGNVLFTYAKGLLKPESMQEAMLLFNKAQTYLEEAVELFSVFDQNQEAHSRAWFLLGEIEFHINEDNEQARLHYERAIKLDPMNRDARKALQIFEDRNS